VKRICCSLLCCIARRLTPNRAKDFAHYRFRCLVVFFVFALLWGLESTVVLASPSLQEPPPTAPASQGNPLAGQWTEERKQRNTVPIRFDPPHQPVILVEVYLLKEDAPLERPQAKPLLFAVDTGMPASFLLTEWAVKEIGFKTVGPPLKDGFQQLEPVKMLCLHPEKDIGFFLLSKKGAYQAKNLSVFDQFSRQRIAGIIGMQMLVGATSIFNFDKKTWTFLPDTSVPRSSISDNTLTLPYRFEPTMGVLKGILPLIEIVVHGQTKENMKKKKSGEAGQKRVTVIFDTGSMNTTIDKEQIKGLSLETRSPIRREMRRAHGTFPVTTTSIPSLRVGGKEFGPFAADVITDDSSVLGMDFLSQFNITISSADNMISGPDNMIYLEPRVGEAARYRMQGTSGISLTEVNLAGKVSFRVSDIGYPATLLPKEELPAIGDEIVSVDGVALENLIRPEADALLQGYADTTAIVTFRSSSPTLGPVIRQVKIRRVSPFDPRLAAEPRTK
jgi:hypothetical protein